jgi:polysaccharide deacetylase family protein (PEP-CTERM system associated)
LEDIIGKEVIGYRAPSYSITKKSLWGLNILAEEGFKYDSSIFPIRHDRYGIPDFSRFAKKINLNGKGEILEIPLSTIQLFGKNIPIAGGGYLRLLPVRFIEWGIRSLNKKEAQPAIIYFHPWEIDPEQPRLNGSRVSVFRHHVNIGKTFSKIKRLLNNFKFGPIRELFSDRFTAAFSSK